MTELMSDDACKFAQTQSADQWNANCQNQIITEEAGCSTSETCRSINFAIEVDTLWHWRADKIADFGDERIESRFVSGIHRQRVCSGGAACEQRLDHEKDEDYSCKNRPEIENRFE